MSEGKLEKVDETFLRDAQAIELGRQGESKDRRVHPWGRRKRTGRQREQLFDAGVELGGGGEQSIVALAGRGRQPIRNFFLHRDDHNVEAFPEGEQVQKNVRGDVVGEITNHVDRFGRVHETGA